MQASGEPRPTGSEVRSSMVGTGTVGVGVARRRGRARARRPGRRRARRLTRPSRASVASPSTSAASHHRRDLAAGLRIEAVPARGAHRPRWRRWRGSATRDRSALVAHEQTPGRQTALRSTPLASPMYEAEGAVTPLVEELVDDPAFDALQRQLPAQGDLAARPGAVARLAPTPARTPRRRGRRGRAAARWRRRPARGGSRRSSAGAGPRPRTASASRGSARRPRARPGGRRPRRRRVPEPPLELSVAGLTTPRARP